MAYKNELRKVKVLLVLGVIIAIILSIYVYINYGSYNPFEIETLFILIIITLYPLGIFYGWRQMMGFVGPVNPGIHADRYYTKQERISYLEGNWLAFGIRVGVVICFGWLIGTWNAWRTLRYLKKSI